MATNVGWLWQFLKNKNGESCPHGLTLPFIEHLEATIGLSTALSSILLRPMDREPEERETGGDGWWRSPSTQNAYQSCSASYAARVLAAPRQ